MAFTAEELEAMRLADEEIDREFCLTDEEFYASRELDQESKDASADEAIARRRKQERERYWKNPEKYRAKAVAYYHANKEKCKAAQKAWRQKHPGDRHRNRTPNQARLEARENGISHQQRYRERHHEEILQRSRAWREANPGYQKEWRAKNPDKVRQYNRSWYMKHREEKLAQNREYYRKRKEAMGCSPEIPAKPDERPSRGEPIST